MARWFKRNFLWVFYGAFLVLAFFAGGEEALFSLDVPFAGGKILVWLIFIAFLAYSLVSHVKESFFKTVRIVNGLWWGRQIGIDLYISVTLSLCLIYLVEGSFLVVLIWFVPILIFANLAILPYILVNYSAIVGNFL